MKLTGYVVQCIYNTSKKIISFLSKRTKAKCLSKWPLFTAHRKQLKQAETLYYSITPSVKTPI